MNFFVVVFVFTKYFIYFLFSNGALRFVVIFKNGSRDKYVRFIIQKFGFSDGSAMCVCVKGGMTS